MLYVVTVSLVIFLLCPAIVVVLCTYFPPLLSRVTMCTLGEASEVEAIGQGPDISENHKVNGNDNKDAFH